MTIEIFENLPNSQGTSGMVKYHTKTPREAWVATLQLEKSEIFSKKNRKNLARKIINLHERNGDLHSKTSIFIKETSIFIKEH